MGNNNSGNNFNDKTIICLLNQPVQVKRSNLLQRRHQIQAFINHASFLFLDKGHVYGCGDNKYGQLGIGSQNQVITTPQRVGYSSR